MDINMPIMGGYECAEKLRQLVNNGELDLKDTKIIACSATSKMVFEMDERCMLFDGFLTKPIQST